MATRTPASIFAPQRVQSKVAARDHQVDLPAVGDVRIDTVFGWPDQTLTGTLRPFFVTVPGTDPKTKRILDVLDARLRSILTANGYKTNAGQNVYADRKSPITASPAILYSYRTHTPDQDTIGLHSHVMDVAIDMLVISTDVDTAADSLRTLHADVTTCIGTDETFTLEVDQVTIDSDDQQIQQEEAKIFSMQMVLRFGYSTERFNAYN